MQIRKENEKQKLDHALAREQEKKETLDMFKAYEDKLDRETRFREMEISKRQAKLEQTMRNMGEVLQKNEGLKDKIADRK